MKEVDIVARATPQIKQQVLQALQDAGHFVAMTGDGVNDATALKQSDVGVAMGLRGTDIAKESAAMVLLDDNFATIVAAVREGRRIFDNIRKFTNYLLSTSLGDVFVVLALSIAGYFPLSAMHAAVGQRRDGPGAGQRPGGRPGGAARDAAPPAPPRRADPEQGHLCHHRRAASSAR